MSYKTTDISKKIIKKIVLLLEKKKRVVVLSFLIARKWSGTRETHGPIKALVQTRIVK